MKISKRPSPLAVRNATNSEAGTGFVGGPLAYKPGYRPRYFYGREPDDGIVKWLHKEIAKESTRRVEYRATTIGRLA